MSAAKRLPLSGAALAMLARLEPAEWAVLLPLAAALVSKRDQGRYPKARILTRGQLLADRRATYAEKGRVR